MAQVLTDPRMNMLMQGASQFGQGIGQGIKAQGYNSAIDRMMGQGLDPETIYEKFSAFDPEYAAKWYEGEKVKRARDEERNMVNAIFAQMGQPVPKGVTDMAKAKVYLEVQERENQKRIIKGMQSQVAESRRQTQARMPFSAPTVPATAVSPQGQGQVTPVGVSQAMGQQYEQLNQPTQFEQKMEAVLANMPASQMKEIWPDSTDNPVEWKPAEFPNEQGQMVKGFYHPNTLEFRPMGVMPDKPERQFAGQWNTIVDQNSPTGFSYQDMGDPSKIRPNAPPPASFAGGMEAQDPLFKYSIDALGKLRTDATDAVSANEKMNMALSQLKSGAGGMQGRAAAIFAPVFELLFGYTPEGMTDQQVWDAMQKGIQGSQRMNIVGPGQVTVYEQQLLAKATAGGTTGRDAAMKLMDFYKKLNDRRVGNYNKTIDEFSPTYPRLKSIFRPMGVNLKESDRSALEGLGD